MTLLEAVAEWLTHVGRTIHEDDVIVNVSNKKGGTVPRSMLSFPS